MKKTAMGKLGLLMVCFWVVLGTINGSTAAAEEEDEIGIYELKKGNMSLKLTNYGAHFISLFLPDKYGKLDDVVLGYDTVKEYLNDTSNFGATVGRVANRIGGAQFTLNGTTYKLVPNEGKNILHGGPKGFGKVIFKVKKYVKEGDAPHVVFLYHSYDGEQGFPGNLRVTVAYTLLKNYRMHITMKARALNKATPVNLANHAYWNLGGQSSGNILSHQVQIFASKYTPVDTQLIPTGVIAPVKGTPFDFLKPYPVGSRIKQLSNGYDINYAVDGEYAAMKKVAVVHDKKSGRVLKLFSNQPGVQFYTSNTLTQKGKGGFVYKPYAALCLETQGYPDAVNHPNFPSTIVYPGETYRHYMKLQFSTSS